MVIEIPNSDQGGLTIRNPATNEPARTGEQAVRFGKMIEDAKVRSEAKNQSDYMNSVHPTGLGEIKNSDGSIARPSGSKPW